VFGSAFSGEQYATLSRFLPRVVLGYVLANTSVFWVQLLVEVNNGLCEAFDPRNALRQLLEKDAEQGTLVFALIFLALIIVFVLAILKMIVRLAVLDLLIVLSPLALLCWVLPQTQGYARAWVQKFTQTLFGQVLFVVALGLAAQLHTVVNMQATTEAFQMLLWVAMLAVSLQAPSLFRAAEHHSGLLGLAAVQGIRSLQARARGARGDRATAAYRSQVLAQGERQHQERMGQTERHSAQRLALASSLNSAHQEFNEARQERSTAEAERRFQESQMLRGSGRRSAQARVQAAPDSAIVDTSASSRTNEGRQSAPPQRDTVPILRGAIEGPTQTPQSARSVGPQAPAPQPESNPVAYAAAQKSGELRAKQAEFLVRAVEADSRAATIREQLGAAAESHPAHRKHTAVARTYRTTAAEYETGAMLAETQYRILMGRELRPDGPGEGDPKGPTNASVSGRYDFGRPVEAGDA
ncbi:MAG: type IV secretion system protein, partial [Chloroflexota bacterium]|nr:type IV secretion system protein [Chloroflexota bacterium]